ncbi:IS110 family transposase [Methylobacterium longum]|uniref:IS110 family transposase n=1 Tax=Methylobacterium longum TaxID=767694 RepID=A0ABT8AHV8_9HYPH|nr:IS110 family transposase [Methylobacterium longum]MDN3569322.1 IS110 family transposase [Methylobacterium longum]GJE14605.1 IS110 family transposase ISMdi10 [Methylobacterium longum]
MSFYVGLDVSTKETAICVVDETGERVWAGTSRTDPDAIGAVLKRRAPGVVKVGIETGPLTVWLWHALNERGVPIVCLHARHAAAALKLQMNKTDRNDALGLARLVRSGWYRPVAVRSIETHRLRALLVARDQLVGMRTALINKIRGLAKTFGILIGPGKGGTFVRQVRAQLPDDPILTALFETLLTLLGTLQERSHEIAKQLARVARQNKICQLLMTTPGVGSITAISFVTTIEDPRRFRRSQDVGAYLGLTPRRYQSGDVDINGRISKCGDRLTRKLLFEAANAMLSRISMPLALKEWGAAIGRRSGFWKARVALARKLSVILHRMWIDERPFEPKVIAMT